MSVSRRSALVSVSALAVTAANASVARGVHTVLNAGVHAAPDTSQRIQHLLVHRDAAAGGPHFAPISFASGDTAWMSQQDLDERAYLQASAKYAMRGYRLRRVNAFQTNAGMRYAAIWQLASGPAQETRYGMTQAEFQEHAGRFAARGYTLAHIDGCATNGGARFAAIWEKRAAPAQKVFAALTATQLKRKSAELAAQGYRPRQIAGYAQGRAQFAAIFEKGATVHREVHHAMTASTLSARSNAMFVTGYRLSDAGGYVVRGRPMFSGIWEKA
jgi:hypothetical protein